MSIASEDLSRGGPARPLPSARSAGGRIVDVRSADKWFGRLHVLDHVSLSVESGEVVVICGPSGSGKSTLLRCLNGLEQVSNGSIEIAGHVVTADQASLEAVRRDVGMVFQQFNLFTHLRVLTNVALALRRVKRLPRREAEEQALALLDRVGIAGKARNYPQQLSGGEQQRVAIARALAMRPKVMLFDEPTSALDPEMTKEVVDVMRDLAQGGMTMLVVTHEMGFANEAANRVLFMDVGQILEDLPTAEFFASPREARTREFLAKIMRH